MITSAEHVAAALAATPEVRVDAAAYRAWLDAAVLEHPDGVARLERLDAGETLLCWAAGWGHADAVRLVDTRYLPHVVPALRRFRADSALVDEITQQVRVRLLVAPTGGGPAAIGRYALAGNLAGLVRVAAVRAALNLRQAGRLIESASQLADDVVGEADPALAALKRRYAREFEQAFTHAASQLTARERNLLRLHLSAHASIDEIARIYRTHRATAARWINAARDQLATGTRAQLQTKLRLPEGELESLLRLVRTEATRLLDSIVPMPGDDGA